MKVAWKSSAAAALVFAAVSVPAFAVDGDRSYGPHMMWGNGWMGWFMGPLTMLVFLAIAVAVVVLMVRWLGGVGQVGPHHRPEERPALRILEERYARGEIEKDEFEERRRTLGA